MEECPNRLDTLAIETPAYIKREAWVCLSPWIEMTGTPTFLQWRSNHLFGVELQTEPLTKIGLSWGKSLMSC